MKLTHTCYLLLYLFAALVTTREKTVANMNNKDRIEAEALNEMAQLERDVEVRATLECIIL